MDFLDLTKSFKYFFDMKTFSIWIVVLIIGYSCNTRLLKPKHIIEHPKESIDADSYSNIPNPYVPKDSSINYTYFENTQIHDYSYNWDLDGDGLLDDLFFVSNGGAHTIYSLVVRLKSQGVAYSFEFITTDFPKLETMEALMMSDSLSVLPKFVIHDFNSDGILDVYLNTEDGPLDVYKQERLKLGLKTRKVIISFNTGQPVLRDYNFSLKGQR